MAVREGAPRNGPSKASERTRTMDDSPKAGLAGPLADGRTARVTPEEALALHAEGRPGKLEIRLTKPLITARDLSLAYSPGVAEPCLHIHRDRSLAYDYTAKG